MSESERQFSPEELKQCDGKDGRPMYVAYKGVVYDVSNSKLWRTGLHMRKHAPGADLTRELADAPHSEEVFTRVPRVGVIAGFSHPETESPAQYHHLPKFLSDLLHRVPFLERHPHPMTVHFPIAFMIATPVFAILYVVTGVRAFELTAANMLAAGMLFSLVAAITGFITWWINYEADPVKAVTIKIITTALMFLDSLVALIWRILRPEVLVDTQPARWVYFALILALLPAIGVIGWFGATLTFPLREPHHRPRKP